METSNFTACQTEEIVQFAHNATLKQIEANLSKMNPEQVSIFFKTLGEKNFPEGRQKTIAAVMGLSERAQLEAAGSIISVSQFLNLINSCLQVEDKHHWKLSPLLVGISHETFSAIFDHLPLDQLQVFKDEGATEPVQHHLTTMVHEMESEIERWEASIEKLYEKVDQFNQEETDLHNVRTVVQEIEHGHTVCANFIKKNNKLLAIAWNTKRLDLIESLNGIKESCRKLIQRGLGLPPNPEQPAKGLYLLLEEKLFDVYGNSQNRDDAEAVRDSEPAVEGLVKLSVWYLRDYWEMGLLPEIRDTSDLDLDLDAYSEVERVRHREKLFLKAQENLSLIGLSTVRDLKTHFIFSKKILKEYIQEKMPSIHK